MPTPKLIPTVAGDPNYTMRVKLDGRDFTFRVKWNERLALWHLDILSSAEELLVGSITIVSNWPLLRFYQWDTRLPPGELMAHDFAGDGSPPGLFEMVEGGRVELTYHPLTDL